MSSFASCPAPVCHSSHGLLHQAAGRIYLLSSIPRPRSYFAASMTCGVSRMAHIRRSEGSSFLWWAFLWIVKGMIIDHWWVMSNCGRGWWYVKLLRPLVKRHFEHLSITPSMVFKGTPLKFPSSFDQLSHILSHKFPPYPLLYQVLDPK